MSKHTYLFSLKTLSFKFSQTSTVFFENLSLIFESGIPYFVYGNNGVGKSTLFRILQGDIHKHEYCSGSISIGDIYMENAQDRSYGKYVRLLSQDVDTMIADTLTVQQNLQCALLPTYPNLQKLPQTTGLDVLASYGITAQQTAGSLSGGQRQILSIIMALQKPTRALLLDEPTAALDSNNACKVMEFITDIAKKQNIVVIIISHDRELITKYAEKEHALLLEEKNGIRHIKETI